MTSKAFANATDANRQQGGRRNLILNSAMQVAQRGTSATVSNNSNEGYSTLDRWYLNFNNSIGGAVSFSQSTDAPDGFANSLKVQCSTVNTSFTTNQYVSISQRIEARDLQRLAYGSSGAKSMVLSWRMKSVTYTGPITIALETRDGTFEYYVKSYTPTTSWAEYTCVIPPSLSATINNDSGEGIRLSFVLAGDSGSSIAASSDSTSWSTTRADYRSDVGNILSNVSNEIYITGVQLEVGDTATPFEHRSYGEELALCQRYYQLVDRGSGIVVSSTNAYINIPYIKTMRASPSFGTTGGLAINDVGVNATQSTGDITAYNPNTSGSFTEMRNFSGLTQYRPALMRGNAGTFVTLDAEL